MILALQMLQERGVGQQKEEERRREVGCQWESPVERREVGCQSETVERRDTAVQVDLLSQQLTWRQTGCQCVSVRADEPGGGALLQHCSTEQTGSCTPETGEQINRSLPQTDEQSPAQQLDLPNQKVVEKSAGLPPSVTPTSPINSTLPLYLFCANQKSPLLPSTLEEELPCLQPKMLAPPIQLDQQQITFIPSMSLCNDSSYAGLRCDVSPPPAPVDSSAPPLGLIAPLSPRLAEEEEDATQQQEKKIQEAPQVERSKRNVGPPVRYLLESEEQSHATTRGAKAKRGAGRLRKVLLEREGEEELSWMDQEHGDEEREGVAEVWLRHCKVCALSFTSDSTLQTHMMVHGSRWCLTHDLCNKRWNHALCDINGCHGDVDVPCYIQSPEACGTSGGKEEEDANGDAGMSDSPRYKEVIKRRDEEEDKPHFQAFTKGWLEQIERRRGRKRLRSRDKDDVVKQVRIKEKNGGEVQKGGEEDLKETPLKSEEKMTEQLQRPRRKMVGPPIRYLLESEEQSHVVVTASQDRAKGLKIKEGSRRLTKFLMYSKIGGGVSADRVITESPEDTGETDRRAERQAGQPAEGETGLQSRSPTTSNARGLKIKRGRGRSRNVVMNNKDGDGASVDTEMKRGSGWEDQNRGRDEERSREEMEEDEEILLPGLTNAANWSRFGCVRRNGRHWLSYRKKIKTIREAIRKRWREQKEGGRERKQSRNEDASVKQVQIEEKGGEDGKERPQRPRRKMVGPPIRYLLESEEQSLCVVTANQDRARGRLMKDLMDSKSGSGASVYRIMTESSKDMGETDRQLDRQADQMLSERQAGLSHGPLTVNQDTVRGLKIKRGGGRPRKVVIHSKAGGGSSVDTVKAEWENKKRQRDEERSKEEVEEDDMPHLPALTNAANWSRFRCVHGNVRHGLSYRKKSKMVQEAIRNRWMEQKEGGTGRKMSRNEDAVVKQVQIEENGGEDGKERQGKDLLKGREVFKERLSQSKENRTEQLQRPRRKMVGPPIRYLLESEEQSIGVVAANQDRVRGKRKIKAGRGRPRKLLMDSKTGGGASVDRVFTASPEDRGETDKQAERQTGQMLAERQTDQSPSERKTDQTLTDRQTIHTLSEGQTGQPVTERQTGQTLSDRQTGQPLTERQTGLYRMSYFIYKDIGSGQVTVLVPCFVRLEQIHC